MAETRHRYGMNDARKRSQQVQMLARRKFTKNRRLAGLIPYLSPHKGAAERKVLFPADHSCITIRHILDILIDHP
jgi:hypothetical protein